MTERCPAPWDPGSERHWLADPGPDAGGLDWAPLLAASWRLDGRERDGAFGLLRGLRCLGAKLSSGTRGPRLVPPADMGHDEMDELVGEHRAAVLRLLSEAAP